jgi:hypothetical protein
MTQPKYLIFKEENWRIINPANPEVNELFWVAHHHPDTLSRSDIGDILEMAKAYSQLATHQAGTESCLKKLRAIRRAIRDGEE